MGVAANGAHANSVETAIRGAKVLVVDDEFYMRKLVRTLLLSMGVTDVHDAADGASALAAMPALDPDVVILDWQMAGMNGPEFVRRVRSSTASAHPNVPIIMLTGHGGHSRVIEAMRLGVHEFLVKPVSGKALYERLASVLLNPRPMVKRGDYHDPAPRTFDPAQSRSVAARRADRPEVDDAAGNVIFLD
jgi:two-component system chemotaxis response regulator CheY